jgi:lysophospholipase L1-like esterase
MLYKIDRGERGDAIVVAGGTNDYAAEIPLGTARDRCRDTFFGAARMLFEKIGERYSPECVYVISPIRRENDANNGKGHSHRDYCDALLLLAREFGYFAIDGYGVPIDPKKEEDKKAYMLDGLHPGPVGHRLFAEYVISKIKG